MRTIAMFAMALVGGLTPVAAQGRWSLESGATLAHMNDDNQWAAAADLRLGYDAGGRARLVFGLARWFDPFDTNGAYSWGGIGAELGASVLMAQAGAVGIRATGMAHGSVGDDGDGTLRVQVGPAIGLRLEALLAGPLRVYIGGAGHVFVVTDGGLDPGGSMHAGLAVRL